MSETLTLRQIVERDGSCVVVFRKDKEGDYPVKAYDKYPPARKLDDTLTEETGIKHNAVLVMSNKPFNQVLGD